MMSLKSISVKKFVAFFASSLFVAGVFFYSQSLVNATSSQPGNNSTFTNQATCTDGQSNCGVVVGSNITWGCNDSVGNANGQVSQNCQSSVTTNTSPAYQAGYNAGFQNYAASCSSSLPPSSSIQADFMGHQMSFSPDTSGSYVNCVDIGVTRYVQKANFSANGLPGNGFIDSSLTNGVPGGADRCNSSDITAVNCFGSWRATLCSQNANGKSYIPSGDGTCTPVAAVCKINSFTCTGTNPDLAWSTSNCTGITINNSVGSVPAVGSYSPAAFGTVYTMSTAEGVSAQSNPCPAAPTAALDSVWQENNAKTITK
jgi:hypothetical protein